MMLHILVGVIAGMFFIMFLLLSIDNLIRSFDIPEYYAERRRLNAIAGFYICAMIGTFYVDYRLAILSMLGALGTIVYDNYVMSKW